MIAAFRGEKTHAELKSEPHFGKVGQAMSVEKTLEMLLCGESEDRICFEELCHLLQAKGFRMRVSGSHHIFTRPGVMEQINLQREGSKAKPYQVRQARKILAAYKLL